MFRLGKKIRRLIFVLILFGTAAVWLMVNPESYDVAFEKVQGITSNFSLEQIDLSSFNLDLIDFSNLDLINLSGIINKNQDDSVILAKDILEKLEIKGRAPKTGYSREEFYLDWPNVDGCNLRQRIIKREFSDKAVLDGCNVISGEYQEPYTGEYKIFKEKSEISSGIQIDHVVALSDAWQKGAQYKTKEERYNIATDPLNLIAVDSTANQQKSDGDAATWLPSNKQFRCQYVARQVSVKYKYGLWVTEAEKDAINQVLENCPLEPAIGVL